MKYRYRMDCFATLAMTSRTLSVIARNEVTKQSMWLVMVLDCFASLAIQVMVINNQNPPRTPCLRIVIWIRSWVVVLVFLLPFFCVPLTVKTLCLASNVYRECPQNPPWRGLERGSGKILFVFETLYALSLAMLRLHFAF